MVHEKSSPSLHRLPPQNNEAEQCVLGSILQQPGCLDRAVEVIKPEDFYLEAHQAIFKAMITLSDRNVPQDLVTVSNLLKDWNKFEAVGGLVYLSSLADVVPVASNITYYARIVRGKSILRRLIATATEMAGRCYEEQDDVETLLDDAEQSIFEIARAKSDRPYYEMEGIIMDVFKHVETLYERKAHITGVPTGYEEFDKMTAGLQKSDLIIVAGRPSMGKTAIAMNIVQHAAIIEKVPVGVFSLEMSKEQLGMRMLCSVSRVDSHRIRTGFLSEGDWPKLNRAVGILAQAPIYIDDTPAISILELRAKARRLKREKNLGMVVVDYLQLMRGRGSADSREQEVSEISRSLKAMAKELSIPVVALSQLNRSLENRTDKRPQLADLRESGAIEQDADVIMFVYRDEVYNKSDTNPYRGTAEVIIGKQRNGPVGTIRLAFLGNISTFENLTIAEPPPTQTASSDLEAF